MIDRNEIVISPHDAATLSAVLATVSPREAPLPGAIEELVDMLAEATVVAPQSLTDVVALDSDSSDVLIELAMTDPETLARVVDAVGPMFSAHLGGGPRGTLLHQAAWLGRVELVELLLQRGADPNATVETEYATPLGWAAVGSRYTPDHPNNTFSAPGADYVGSARLLVDAGATIAVMDVEMASPPMSEWLANALQDQHADG